jgi:colanic acid/amylovoran biosynthesis protein
MNLLIVNLHSALNLGDDAIMYATLPAVRRAFPHANIYLLANDPHSWEKHLGVQSIGSFQTWVVNRQGGKWQPNKVLAMLYPFVLLFSAFIFRCFRARLLFGNLEQRRLLETYYSADLVLSCGGGNFYSNKKLLGFGFLWTILELAFAMMLAKKTVLLPQSIGPVPGKLQRWLAKITFSRADKIMVRDVQSENMLKDLGVKAPCVLLPDLAFSLPSEFNLPQNSRGENGLPLQVGITVINRGAQVAAFKGQLAYEHAIVNALLQLSKKYPLKIHIFSQCFGPSPDQDDRVIAEEIYASLRAHSDQVYLHNEIRDALDLQSAYRQMDIMVGSRMHTAILALISAVPVVLIGYQSKAQGMMRFFGFDQQVIPIEAITTERLAHALTEVIEERAERRQIIVQKGKELSQALYGWERNLRI